jgi:N-acetylmuramic acid 6-phosphate etherase
MEAGHRILITESRNPASTNLGDMTPLQVVELMASEDHRALSAVAAVSELLADVAERVARAFKAGGRTILLGAGTSGRLAIQEVAELPPTFGVAREQFHAFVSSATPVGPSALTTSEDDTDAIVATIARETVGNADVVIGIAASGQTPFVLAGVEAARQRGAWCCGIANNPNTPLLAIGHLGVLLDTGPEVLTGSTRLKAGTAQKVALNRITTAAMVGAGRVVSNHMVNIDGTTTKLRDRAMRIVRDLCQLSADDARTLLEEVGWHVEDAIRRCRV